MGEEGIIWAGIKGKKWENMLEKNMNWVRIKDAQIGENK